MNVTTYFPNLKPGCSNVPITAPIRFPTGPPNSLRSFYHFLSSIHFPIIVPISVLSFFHLFSYHILISPIVFLSFFLAISKAKLAGISTLATEKQKSYLFAKGWRVEIHLSLQRLLNIKPGTKRTLCASVQPQIGCR